MPRLPNVTLPITPLPRGDSPRRRPTPPLAPSPSPSTSPSTSRSARAKLKAEIRATAKKLELATRSFYEVGAQLNTWKKTQAWRALSSTATATRGGDFKAFVTANVMPYSTASRLMRVAQEYPKSVATKLGIEKGFQLARYARLANDKALTLVRRDARLGTPPTPVSELSAQDIEWLVKSLRMSDARAAAPKATRDDKRVARVFARRFTSELGVDADVSIAKKRNKLRLELDLDLARSAI